MYQALLAVRSAPLLDAPIEIRDREAQFKLVYRTVHNGEVVDLPQ